MLMHYSKTYYCMTQIFRRIPVKFCYAAVFDPFCQFLNFMPNSIHNSEPIKFIIPALVSWKHGYKTIMIIVLPWYRRIYHINAVILVW